MQRMRGSSRLGWQTLARGQWRTADVFFFFALQQLAGEAGSTTHVLSASGSWPFLSFVCYSLRRSNWMAKGVMVSFVFPYGILGL